MREHNPGGGGFPRQRLRFTKASGCQAPGLGSPNASERFTRRRLGLPKPGLGVAKPRLAVPKPRPWAGNCRFVVHKLKFSNNFFPSNKRDMATCEFRVNESHMLSIEPSLVWVMTKNCPTLSMMLR